MYLYITKETELPDDADNLSRVTLTVSQFCLKSYHPFIASKDWDYVVFDLDEVLTPSYIKELVNKDTDIKFKVRDDVKSNFKITSILSTVYPDHSAKFRKAAITKSSVVDILRDIGAIYE